MMTRFSPKLGAMTLVGMGALYLVLTLITGHSAASEPPPDLAATEAGLDPWRAAALMLEQPDTCVADVRSEERFALYHLPRAQPAKPEAAAVQALCSEARAVLLVADKDEEAAELIGSLQQQRGDDGAPLHFVRGGAQAWYLAFALPVPLFSDKPPPFRYQESLAQVRRWLEEGAQPDADQIAQSLGVLIRADYQPTALQSKKKKSGAKKRKAISGGCG